MALTSKSWNRPKLAATITEEAVVDAALATDDTNSQFVVNIFTSVTKDDSTVVSKLLCRLLVPVSISGTSLKVSAQPIVFQGSVADYVAGITTPASSAGNAGVVQSLATVDLDAFYTAAGDTRKNS